MTKRSMPSQLIFEVDNQSDANAPLELIKNIYKKKKTKSSHNTVSKLKTKNSR